MEQTPAAERQDKRAYAEPTVVEMGTVEELTGWITVGTTFDNPFTNHRRLN